MADRVGLHEALLTEALAASLLDLDDRLHQDRHTLRAAEAADRIALHLSRVIERAIATLDEKERATAGAEVARQLIRRLDELVVKADVAGDAPVPAAEILEAILGRNPDGSTKAIERPMIPLLDTTLLTNAPGEPRVGKQIETEIHSADRIDLLMAFIRRSGIQPMLDALRRHCDERGLDDLPPLRVLTTTYTDSTERAALDLLAGLGADVRVSYDTSTTRLHAKAWLFHRWSGFPTAYVGSSNLTHSAQITGLEWNVRVSGARNPDVIDKIAAVFDAYWESSDFRPYDPDEFDAETQREAGGPTFLLSPIEIRPEPFQERLLEQIAVARQKGHHRNLLVSATGTGKTVMAAVDYARLRTTLPRARLLFVAHRKELLEQSRNTFKHAMRDPAFGELWVGGTKPTTFEHVFASIQSLAHADLADLTPDHFDVVIIDEFHHAAAPTYQRLLDHVRPRELLGLTATPERADGLPLLHLFDDRIAAELRLWDAIDQHRLTPFAYYGIHDGLDLRDVPWKRGRGYDVEGLTNVYTADDAWVRQVIQQLGAHVNDVSQIRALGFCVSVEHARFMARRFREHGIAAVAVWADTPADERRAAPADLAEGRVNVVFSVDLFNEGVDIPLVDTLLLLRPTDSPTLFLQQLGRGLRRAHGKTVCTVLDFVGHHRREFRLDRRFRALLGGTRSDLRQQVEGGFPFLPAGCHLELDPVAQAEVLRSIRESVPSQWAAKVAELRTLVDAGHEVSLASYLDESGLELDDVYAGNHSWSDLCRDAGVAIEPAGPNETELSRAVGRLLHIDDTVRIDAYQELLASTSPPTIDRRSECEQRLARMLVASIADRALTKGTDIQAGIDLVWRHPQVLAELRELLAILRDDVDHVQVGLADTNVPLQVHARYTRREILAGFGVGDGAKVAPWQTGVYWSPEAQADLFAFTLDKTAGSFSPTTRYRDYAISPELIHWESQSVTRADSDTGQRYQRHAELGTSVMLFARLNTSSKAFWFLGPATYVRHRGERPMAITWQLRHPLPGDLFASFAAAVA